jgi:GNAT superfamily N-acetyltransferase
LESTYRIRLAQKNDLTPLSELFNLYRCFYGCVSDLRVASEFLSDRLQLKDSVIFIAETENNHLVGFAQLYPTFSSVALKKAWILNDLYVSQNYRRYRVATRIIVQALDFCRDNGAVRLSLQTGKDNIQAKNLYEQIGFVKENYFLEFSYEFLL